MSPEPETTFDVYKLPGRIVAKINFEGEGGCWLWTAQTTRKGYGRVWWYNGPGKAMRRAHRVVYELLVGEIPDGLHIDHLCFTRHCVNPAHLEPVTLAENNRRTSAAGRHKSQKVVACPAGHPYNEANTYVSPRGGRDCRPCRAARERGRYERRKLEATTTNP